MQSTVDKNGLTVAVKKGDLFAETAGVIAISVDEKLHGPMREYLAQTIGAAVLEEALTKAKTAHKRTVMQGEILPLDFTAAGLSFQYVILVLRPLAAHLKMAYKSIFQFAVQKGLTSVALPGLGCGGTDVPSAVSATKLHDVVSEWPGGFTGIPKTLTVVDLFDATVADFQAAFGLSSPSSSSSSSSSASAARRARRGAAPAAAADQTPEQIVRGATQAPQEIEEIDCSVCMESLREEGGEEVVALTGCGHQIHFQCFVAYLTNANRRSCWICGAFFGRPLGNMPEGRMTHSVLAGQPIEGHPDADGVICIDYSFRSGIQGPLHPRPGVPYQGTRRYAYLPNNDQGRLVLRLLEKAFECKLTFTVGDSVTSGAQDVVVWNNVHHKTSLHGGPQAYGYPDEGYLGRLTEELAGLGITEALL